MIQRSSSPLQSKTLARASYGWAKYGIKNNCLVPHRGDLIFTIRHADSGLKTDTALIGHEAFMRNRSIGRCIHGYLSFLVYFCLFVEQDAK